MSIARLKKQLKTWLGHPVSNCLRTGVHWNEALVLNWDESDCQWNLLKSNLRQWQCQSQVINQESTFCTSPCHVRSLTGNPSEICCPLRNFLQVHQEKSCHALSQLKQVQVKSFNCPRASCKLRVDNFVNVPSKLSQSSPLTCLILLSSQHSTWIF